MMLCLNCYAINLVVVQVNWTVSRVSVTEGDVVRLSGTALGIYANSIAIGVYCKCSHFFSSEVETGMDIGLYIELTLYNTNGQFTFMYSLAWRRFPLYRGRETSLHRNLFHSKLLI